MAEKRSSAPIAEFVSFIALLLALPGSVVLAWRSVRLGRGDPRGARRVGWYVFAVMMLFWVFRADHVLAPLGIEYRFFMQACGFSLFAAAWCWLLYMGLEPYVRRWWPHALIGWTRLLAGRFDDPRVGRDVLIGAALGLVSHALLLCVDWLLFYVSPTGVRPYLPALDVLGGLSRLLSSIFNVMTNALVAPMVAIVILLMVRVVVRQTWIAGAVSALMLVGLGAFGGMTLGPPILYLDIAARMLIALLWIACLTNFGLLTQIVAFFFIALSQAAFVPSGSALWTVQQTWVIVILLGGLLGFSYWRTIAATPLRAKGAAE